MLTMMRNMFARTFSRAGVLQSAREDGAVQRLRDIHPADSRERPMDSAAGWQ